MQKHKNTTTKLILITALLLILPIVYAQREGSIPLLALVESGGESRGGVATLNLAIREGNGGVFLDTFPLTKTSTQISMRFAQQTACQELNLDCSNLDFFYTIRSAKGIVGGPSAGAAATILTAAVLENKKLNETVAMTGTINSGGMVGSVGGLKEKISAAAEKNFSKVLIPKGTAILKENNSSINLIDYGKNLSIKVIEVGTLSEALNHFDGAQKEEKKVEFVISENYKKLMKEVADELCGKVKTFPEELRNYSKKALDEENYYSAASLCFRSLIDQRKKEYSELNATKENLEALTETLSKKINITEKDLMSEKVNSLTALQTFMAVKERIDEAKELFEEIKNRKNEDAITYVAFAEERLNSAKLWMKFFKLDDKKVELNDKNLKISCENKLAEIEERLQYISEYLPIPLVRAEQDLKKAYDFLEKDPISCLYLASRTKASVDIVVSLLGVPEERLKEILDIKLSLAQKALVRAQQKGIFPLISYSYYEYADSLKEFDVQSALLYAEYALEFATLDIYFPPGKFYEQKPNKFFKEFSINSFLLGIGLTLLGLSLMIYIKKHKHPTTRKTKQKKSKF
ncbi:hypothetical protein HZA97_00165 [Candidatus Woesearchaeota archaeon]|nr:hypothetical protein [Candidatus Woesearchaeota archaeon]